MYEKPMLNRVGDAQDVILGYISVGSDYDTTWMASGNEYADDNEGVSLF